MNLRWRQHRSSRLVDAIRDRIGDVQSARAIKRSLEANGCRINGKVERFASATVNVGDVVELASDWLDRSDKDAMSCSILYEHADFLAIDKPAGAVCSDPQMRQLLKRPVWLAHRLDKETTGVLLLGKTVEASLRLQKLFSQRTMVKSYLAIADGIVHRKEGEIATHFIKDRAFHGQTIWKSNPEGSGAFAKTSWKTLATGREASLILCLPFTGRTHQIRVHLAEIGHPILTDRQYASRFVSKYSAHRPLLHAWKIEFPYGSETIRIQADLPKDMQEALSILQIRTGICDEALAVSDR